MAGELKTHLLVSSGYSHSGSHWNFIVVRCGRSLKMPLSLGLLVSTNKLLERKQVTNDKNEVTCANCRKIINRVVNQDDIPF